MLSQEKYHPYPSLTPVRIQASDRKIEQSSDISKKNRTAVLFGSGLAASYRSAAFLPELAKNFRVFGIINAPPERRRARGEKLPDNPELLKADRFLDSLHSLREQSIENVSLVLHSEGATYGTLAAAMAIQDTSMYPKIENIILLNPASFVRQSAIGLGARFTGWGLYDWKYREVLEALRKDDDIRKKSFLQLPFPPKLLFKELQSISSTNILPILAMLQSQGVSIHVISSSHDRIIPHAKVRKVAEQMGISFIPLSGPHEAPQAASYAHEYAEEISKILSSQ